MGSTQSRAIKRSFRLFIDFEFCSARDFGWPGNLSGFRRTRDRGPGQILGAQKCARLQRHRSDEDLLLYHVGISINLYWQSTQDDDGGDRE
jgi:hypothetical protein